MTCRIMIIFIKIDLLELSFISTGILVGSWLFYIQFFLYWNFFGCMLGVFWRFEHETSYIGTSRFKVILACQEVLEWVWPPHRLQACPENIPNMKSFACKAINFLTNSLVGVKDNSFVQDCRVSILDKLWLLVCSTLV